MCTRIALLFSFLLSAPAVMAGPAASPDAALVVILLDGLVEECIDARVDGSQLMPATSIRVEGARRFIDVLTPNTNPDLGRVVLDEALAGFGAAEIRKVRAASADTLDTELAGLARRAGRQVLVLDVPWLEPPLQLEEEILDRLDPAPWTSMSREIRIESRVPARDVSRLDPAPGTSMSSEFQIESQVLRRRARARRLAALTGRGAGRGRKSLILDVQWVIRSAHAGVDARLAALLDRVLLDPVLRGRTMVVLTAVSSTGTGVRGPIGPYVGVELDVARVPVFVWADGIDAGPDPRPRQWIGFDDAWFDGLPPEDRFTWSWGSTAPNRTRACALRWTTEGFTLVDSSQPRRPPRLYDRRLDPGEWYDRAVSEPALADSLQRGLRARLYGAQPVVVLEAGDAPLTLRPQSRTRLALDDGRILPEAVRIEPGQRLRVRLIDGAETLEFGRTLRLEIGSEVRELSALVLHSPSWRAALGDPGAGPGPRLWIE